MQNFTAPDAQGSRLYPQSRTDAMSTGDLRRTLDFALADAAAASSTLYHGMDRDSTVATALRTVNDVQAALSQPRHTDPRKATGAGAALDALLARTGGGKVCGLHGTYSGSYHRCPSC
jgi:hypothetical protein